MTDPKNPTLAHKQVIGTRGSSSEALTNHLAFNYFAPKHLLAIPMTICEGGGDGSYGSDMTFSGLIVYDTTVAGGFHELGRVAHPPRASANGQYNSGACSNWWTNASSEVKRSIVFDDVVFSVSSEEIKASALASLATTIATVPLTP